MTAKSQISKIEELHNGEFSIRVGDVSLLINSKLGGRIISAKYEHKEILLQENTDLVNFGSTFWPAPQSNWNWPPPNAIQLGVYHAEINGGKLILKSGTDEQYGMSAQKIFSTDEKAKCIRIEYQLTNKTDSVMAVGPWEITCVPAEGSVVFYLQGKTPANTEHALDFDAFDGIGWFDYDPEKLSNFQKLFNNATEGWMAHVNREQVLFIKKFEQVSGDSLAPGQGNVEVFVNRDLNYIELENHGKYEHLQPNQSLFYKVKWYISMLPSDLKADKYSGELINYVRSIIN